jgi:ActR/RegA family two-component response regulator
MAPFSGGPQPSACAADGHGAEGLLSVVGSLEDLSFPDILQVVHLSRQSGTLILSDKEGERRVRFRHGLVCDATLGAGRPPLDQLLIAKGLVAPAALEPARARAAQTGESLAAALVGLGALSQETLDRVVREELRDLVRSFVLLQEGEFRFEVDESAPPPEEAEGLEPEAILGGLPQAAPPRWPEGASHGVPRQVLLVSERSFLTLALREELERVGFEVTACESAPRGEAAGRELLARQAPFFLVCDLILPDATKTGWGGGIELVRNLRGVVRDLLAVMIGEIRHPSAAVLAQSAGATGYLALPDLSQAPFEEVGVRVRDFCVHLGSTFCLSDQLAQIDWSAGGRTVRVADPLQLLRGLIGELQAEPAGDVSLLVLRLASEYFERAALFAVSDGRAVCRGAFGKPVDERMRGATFPLEAGSILKAAVDRGEAAVGPVPDDAGNGALRARLGPPEPKCAAVLPVHGGQEVFGILYGDNAVSGEPFDDLRPLEIFLSQAGLTLQNALLRRRIASLESRHEPSVERAA